ncbi:MAG: 4Fe-4S dicluster domain-containing protein [Deltaproteobacteria bacterium]|nr:4Fe-4S dicluster domain-containing protein [Deltaproteobacteria bacterium]
MAHLVGKDIYYNLGKKIDGLSTRVPYSKELHALLKDLYTTEEADLIIRMPYGLADLKTIARAAKLPEEKLKTLLNGLCHKGLVIDFYNGEEQFYMPSPLVIGIFEFTMMRTGRDADPKKWAGLFRDYLSRTDTFYAANSPKNAKVSIARALPHEETIAEDIHAEVLDYEKATAIVDNASLCSIGLCSCRHEKMHVNEKKCDVPLESCTSFGFAADYLIRNGLARQASKTEMRELFARSREMGLVFNADNVQKNISFICHCCGCCCNMLLGISRFGYVNTVVTSNYIAHIADAQCLGCGKCAAACPINAITITPITKPTTRKKKLATINEACCIGCGVCALKCPSRSLTLVKRRQRVFHPETTFERIILQSLERGTLQNQLFDNVQSVSHRFMRFFLGGFLRLPPVKRALVSDTLRSRFLSALKKGVKAQDKEWVTKI